LSMVQVKTLPADLSSPLKVLPITLPPLRDREDAIPLLVQHFGQPFARRHSKSIVHIPNEVMEALKSYHWPGNIRELQNFIERAVIMTTGSVLHAQLKELVTHGPTISGSVRTLADAERAHITATLRETNWVVGGRNGAAAKLGLPRTSLIGRMHRLGISRDADCSRQDQNQPQMPSAPATHAPAPASTRDEHRSRRWFAGNAGNAVVRGSAADQLEEPGSWGYEYR